MFAVIRHYRFDKKDSAAIDRAIREEFVPIVRKANTSSAFLNCPTTATWTSVAPVVFSLSLLNVSSQP